MRANVMARADARTDAIRQKLDPPQTPHVAPGLDFGFFLYLNARYRQAWYQ